VRWEPVALRYRRYSGAQFGVELRATVNVTRCIAKPYPCRQRATDDHKASLHTVLG